jgi:TusA-related sulfurtransferase
MTSKELRKLSRRELIEVLLAQTREMEQLKAELNSKNELLEKREINISESGSIAEAALRLSGIFEDAQRAADTYLAEIKRANPAPGN